MKVRIIASHPRIYGGKPEQDGIEKIIGREYEVEYRGTDDPRYVAVNSPEFGGIMLLNPDEYEVIL